MGSLMAGWGSPVSDPTSVIRERNRSLTKEEIEAYWRSKKQTEEEHLKAIVLQSQFSMLMNGDLPSYLIKYIQTKVPFDESETLPNTRQGFSDMDAEISPGNIINKTGWWRRSNWAFLNEPPVVDRRINSYKPQFHIANLAASKLNKDSGISV